MTSDLSLLHLVMSASLVVQLVMLTLVLASFISWKIIFGKRFLLKRARIEADKFESQFWSVEDLGPLYTQIKNRKFASAGMEKIFESGFREFSRLSTKDKMDPDAMMEGVQRSMRIATSKEIDILETHLSFLATVGSTSPYIGLFGTVWGIMNSFRALGNVQQATISMVAPGISEALIATAIGLFAAIPAVIAYNRYSNDVERLINRYETFTEEFSSILYRHIH